MTDHLVVHCKRDRYDVYIGRNRSCRRGVLSAGGAGDVGDQGDEAMTITPEFLAACVWVAGGCAFALGLYLGSRRALEERNSLKQRNRYIELQFQRFGRDLREHPRSGSRTDIENTLRDAFEQCLPAHVAYELTIESHAPGTLSIAVGVPTLANASNSTTGESGGGE